MTGTPGRATVDVSSVHVSFGDVSVLDGVDLTVEPGEFVGLVGPNGAGKTTLLRTINGIVEPDSGSVTVDEIPLSELSPKEIGRQIATVPQDTHLGFSFTAEQVVEMGRTPHRSRLDWSEDDGPVEAALERTEMVDLRDRAVDDLSGGERQRVLLARALAQEPAVLLLDEPTASLDINHQSQVLGLVEELVDEGRTAVAAIHDLDLAARFCDRLVLLADGEISANGTPGTVLGDSALETAFGTRTAVTRNPATGSPTITAVADQTDVGRVHIAGGGRDALRALRTLWRAGFDVSLGPVPAGDAAAVLAEQLDCELVSAPAFRTLDEQHRRDATELCREAGVLVSTRGAGGDTLADVAETPRIHTAFSGTEQSREAAPAVGDGGTGDGSPDTVGTEDELLAAVRDRLDVEKGAGPSKAGKINTRRRR